MHIEALARDAERSVRDDVHGGRVRGAIAAYEAAQVELERRADAAGITLSRLQVKSLAQKVSAAVTA